MYTAAQAATETLNRLPSIQETITAVISAAMPEIGLFVAVNQWNSWFDAMLYNRMNSSLTTLQYELMKLLSSVTNQGGSAEAMKNAIGAVTPTSVRAAATIITMLPIICIYPFLQKYFVTGLTLGGVKE